ncbi:MAG TPA: ATP-dependent RNA helicase DbpA [Moraxellaceae bacterium]|nr:ATP-dependent RNA helicase DbpA [Moraxellaceae bacterium]
MTTPTGSAAFSSLALPSPLLATLDELGYATMTPIQAQSLPSLLAGRDVIAQARTGSGKTAAFGIGLLTALDPRSFTVQALVLCPTRELADQVMKELRRLARFAGNIKILGLCGGVPMGPQLDSLAHGAHVLVGTPGRVLKHLAKGSVDFRHLRTLVLDEADRMLDMGFHEAISGIADQLPAKRQTLLFSATYSTDIRALSKRFQRDPVEVTVAESPAEASIRQLFFEIDNNGRLPALGLLLRHFRPASAVLFCNTKQRCEEVLQALEDQGFHVAALHGDLEQRDRDQVLVQFANGSCPLLVATDVAARGLDIKNLEAVINVEMAFDPEVHVHRIGRTGRAGQEGLALSLCAPAEAHRVLAVEDYQKLGAEWQALPAAADHSPPALPRMVTLNIAGGRKDKLRPGDILGALTGDAGLAGAQIGKIDIFDQQAFVAVERAVAAAAMKGLGRIKGRAFRVRRL